MVVRELIERLQACPPEARVLVGDPYMDSWDCKRVEEGLRPDGMFIETARAYREYRTEAVDAHLMREPAVCLWPE